jgi:hypothetical protein
MKFVLSSSLESWKAIKPINMFVDAKLRHLNVPHTEHIFSMKSSTAIEFRAL